MTFIICLASVLFGSAPDDTWQINDWTHFRGSYSRILSHFWFKALISSKGVLRFDLSRDWKRALPGLRNILETSKMSKCNMYIVPTSNANVIMNLEFLSKFEEMFTKSTKNSLNSHLNLPQSSLCNMILWNDFQFSFSVANVAECPQQLHKTHSKVWEMKTGKSTLKKRQSFSLIQFQFSVAFLESPAMMHALELKLRLFSGLKLLWVCGHWLQSRLNCVSTILFPW